jgi:hypothetical protein
MTRSSASKFDRSRLIADPIEEFDLLGPSNADCRPPHLRERITVSLHNSAADADVIIERLYPDGWIVRQFLGGGTR